MNALLARKVSASFALVFACMVLCMAFLTGLTVSTLRAIVAGQKAHTDTFIPAKRLTAGFEREMLNARIFFIYFVTIQKPGSLEKGWERFHNGEATLLKMADMVQNHEELANLRGPVAKLQEDVKNYSVALAATLGMVQSGETKGPHYDAQVKEWAARGATMVTDAGSVESLTFRSGEADTKDIADALAGGQTKAIAGFGLGLLLSTVLTFVVLSRLKHFIETVGSSDQSNADTTGLYANPPLSLGAH